MGCILNRERSVPFHSRNGAIPSKTCSIKTPPLLLLFFFFFFFPPQRFFHVRRLEQFLIRSPKPIPPPSRSRSLALFFLFFFLLYICSSYSTPARFIFFFRFWENEGFLWREHLIKDFFEAAILPFSPTVESNSRFSSLFVFSSHIFQLFLYSRNLFLARFVFPCRRGKLCRVFGIDRNRAWIGEVTRILRI